MDLKVEVKVSSAYHMEVLKYFFYKFKPLEMQVKKHTETSMAVNILNCQEKNSPFSLRNDLIHHLSNITHGYVYVELVIQQIKLEKEESSLAVKWALVEKLDTK